MVKRLSDADGLCRAVFIKDKLDHIEIKLKHYSSIIGILESLAHELVHAKQYLKGELSIKKVKKPFLFFFNAYFDVKTYKGKEININEYFELPYEQEAFITSRRLMFELFDFLNSDVTETDSIEEHDKEQESLPRDFNVDFVDPHGDICSKSK